MSARDPLCRALEDFTATCVSLPWGWAIPFMARASSSLTPQGGTQSNATFHRVFHAPPGAVEDISRIPLFTPSLGPTVFTGRAALNTVRLPQTPQVLHIMVLRQRIGDVGRATNLGHVQKTPLHTFLEPQQLHVQMPHLSQTSSGHEGLSH